MVWLHMRCGCEGRVLPNSLKCLWGRLTVEKLTWRNSLWCTQKKSYLKLVQHDVFHIPHLCVHSRALKCWSQGTGPSSTLVHSERRNAAQTDSLEAKWTYCAVRVTKAKQGIKTTDFLPFQNQILPLPSLQPG